MRTIYTDNAVTNTAPLVVIPMTASDIPEIGDGGGGHVGGVSYDSGGVGVGVGGGDSALTASMRCTMLETRRTVHINSIDSATVKFSEDTMAIASVTRRADVDCTVTVTRKVFESIAFITTVELKPISELHTAAIVSASVC